MDWPESEYAPKPTFSTQPAPQAAPPANDTSMAGIFSSIGSAAGGLSQLVGSIANAFGGKSTQTGMPIPDEAAKNDPTATAWDTKKILIIVVSVLGAITIGIIAFKFLKKKKGA